MGAVDLLSTHTHTHSQSLTLTQSYTWLVGDNVEMDYRQWHMAEDPEKTVF